VRAGRPTSADVFLTAWWVNKLTLHPSICVLLPLKLCTDRETSPDTCIQHLNRIQRSVSAYMLRVQTEQRLAFVVHSVFEMDLETAAGVSAAFVASVSTARYRLSDVFHLERDTRRQATLFDVMPPGTREMLPSCDNI
jgi:hypothetical protein